MKYKIRKICYCIITIFLICCTTSYLGHLVRPVDCDIAFNAIETFHDMPEDSIEVIAYGSSHTWRGINVTNMYDEYGIGAYNYGCNWQHLNTTLLFLQDSFKKQSPKVVLIEMYRVHELLEDVTIDGEIYYTRSIPESIEKQEYLKQCFGNSAENYLAYYMPLAAFNENWVNISEKSFMKNSDDTNFYETKGYIPRNNIYENVIPDPSKFEQKELSEDSIAVLDKMVDLCRKNGAEVIFYTLPYSGEFNYAEALKKYAKENDCVYIDFFELQDEAELNGNTDFEDIDHLNINGATKVAQYLGEYIVDNYDVTDMRTIDNNIWEKYSN